jgi:Tol biopolymer transport system component
LPVDNLFYVHVIVSKDAIFFSSQDSTVNLRSHKTMFIKRRIFVLIFGCMIFFQSHSLLQASPSILSQPTASVKITSLGSLPSGFTIINESIQYSLDMRHVTYAMRNEKNQFFVRYDNSISRPYYSVFQGTPYFTPLTNRHVYLTSTSKNDLFVVVDGKTGPTFNKVDAVVFSPDESRFAYRATIGDQQCVVLDHKALPMYDGIPIKKNLVLTFSPDNKHFAYVAYHKEKKSCAFVLDNQELNAYKLIENVIFSPDSKHYAYMALTAKEGNTEVWRVIHNGQESDLYSKIFSINFSPDSKIFSFVALKGRQMALVINSKETLFDQVGITFFSKDSKHMAHAYRKLDNWYIDVDGNNGPKQDGILLFYFSPDCSRFAYSAIQGESQIFYINNTPEPAYDKVGEFSFSPDSKRYAYGAVDKKGARIVVDGKPGPVFTSVGEPRFSPDSQNFIYKAFIPAPYTWFLVLNGNQYGELYYSIDQYLFSPDSKHIAYRALKENGKQIIVVDAKEHQIYRITGMPFFSPEGNHLAYHALTVIGKDEIWHLVVDGKELPETYGGFRLGTPIIFDSDDHFHTIGLRPGPEFLNIEVTIPETWKIKSGI